MTPKQLLRTLERLNHASRMRHMVEVGRLAATDLSVSDTLDQLEHGDFYARFLALQACHGSRDTAHVLRSIGDPSRGIRTFACTLVPLLCDDAQVESALATVSRSQRDQLLRQLQKRHRQTAIDRYVAQRAATADPALERILPYASAQIVEQSLPSALDSMDRNAWLRLARRHPTIAEKVIGDSLNTRDSISARLLWQANSVLVGLSERFPDRAYALAGAFVKLTALDRLDLGLLTARLPIAFVRLTLASGDVTLSRSLGNRANDPFIRAVRQCTDDEVVALVVRGFLTIGAQPNPWFRLLPPARRAAIYLRLRDSKRSLRDDPSIVKLGPRPTREEDARQQLARPGLPDEPGHQLQFASVLPWEEALAVLAPSLASPRTRWRGAALAALVGCVCYSRDRAGDLLTFLHTRRNEQDPVRQSFLQALADLPPGRWRTEHLPQLTAIMHDAVDAADLSSGSVAALEALLVHLLPFHSEWAAAGLADLARELGPLGFRSLSDGISDVEATVLDRYLAPVLSNWEQKGNDTALVSLGAGLGPRLRACNLLLDHLESISLKSRSAQSVETVLRLLRDWAPQRFTSVIPTLVRDDASVSTLPIVSTYLSNHRQDLLTPFLRRRRYSGRFGAQRRRYLPTFDGGFYRWTADQQLKYAAALKTQIDDPDADAPAVLAAIRRLAALPSVAPATLLALAAESAEENVLTITSPPAGPVVRAAPPRRRTLARRDVALRALGRLDGGQGLEALEEATRDDRAGVAIGAMRSAILALPPALALPLLLAIPLDRVRVAKEVVRLLGDLEDGVGYPALLNLAAQPLHRDVRVALLQGLAAHPERKETWTILEEAAQSPDAELAISAGRMPATGLTAIAQRRLINLLVLLLGRPEAEVRAGVLTRCRELPVADPDRRLMPPLLAALASEVPGEPHAGAAAIMSLYNTGDLPAIEDTARKLRAQPNALQALVAAVEIEVILSRRSYRDVARAVLAGLAGDPLLAELRTRLATKALQGDELADWLEQVVAAGEFHPGVFRTALDGMSRSGDNAHWAAYGYLARIGVNIHRLRRGRQTGGARGVQFDIAAMDRLEGRLAAHADGQLRRIALAALQQLVGDEHGWTDERLERLRRFAADPAPLVAESALSALAFVESERRARRGAP